jgi:hypothetical protein
VSHGVRSRRLGLPFVVGLTYIVLAFAATATSSASVSVATSVPGCGNQTFQQAFLRWSDPAWYVLTPKGTFESGGSGWALSGGAFVGSGNDPWKVSGPGSHALHLPSGSSAVSAPTCVSLLHPTLRFFARGLSTSTTDVLSVDILYRDASGRIQSLSIGFVAPTGKWAPTAPKALLTNVLSTLSGKHTYVAFRFTPIGATTWYVDDVYVDPWGKG